MGKLGVFRRAFAACRTLADSPHHAKSLRSIDETADKQGLDANNYLSCYDFLSRPSL